jgi:hypothetical protein
LCAGKCEKTTENFTAAALGACNTNLVNILGICQSECTAKNGKNGNNPVTVLKHHHCRFLSRSIGYNLVRQDCCGERLSDLLWLRAGIQNSRRTHPFAYDWRLFL